jgi:polysaccharide biosynthesis transport protein
METGFDDTMLLRPSHYFAMLKRWCWILVLLPVLAGSIGYWISSQQIPTYTATATLYVSSASFASADIGAARLLAQSYSELVKSRPVLERVIERLELTESAATLSSRIDATWVRDTQVIKVTTKDEDLRRAADITNALGEEFVVWIDKQQTSTTDDSVTKLQQTIDQARADLEKTSADLAALRSKPGQRTNEEQAKIASLDALVRQNQTNYNRQLDLQQRLQYAPQSRVMLTDTADPPSSSDNPSPMRNASLAFVLSLIVAVVAIFLFERLTGKVRLPDDVQFATGLPLLEAIPRLPRKAQVALVAAPHSAGSEAFRSLRTTLHFAAEGKRNNSIIITSPDPNNGKSIVAANLAVAIAQAGLRVVLLDGDLRRPRQHYLFGAKNQSGLSTLLKQERSLLRVNDALVNGPVPGLQLLVAGVQPDNPSELLIGPGLENVLAQLRQMTDVIIIDTPPLLAASDGLLLASEVDHAVIVVDSGRTSVRTLQSALESLKQTRVHLLGSVLYGVARKRYVYKRSPAPDTAYAAGDRELEQRVAVNVASDKELEQRVVAIQPE